MDPRVVAISGASKGGIFRLSLDRVSIGRDVTNTVQMTDATVSKKHCTIEEANGAFEVVDLDSHNGTFVNGIPVKRRALLHGDIIRVGTSELVFLVGEERDSHPSQIEFSDSVSTDGLKTVHLTHAEPRPHSASDIGRMARDLNALFKIARTITSIPDLDDLQTRLLELIFEVVPADIGAILRMDHVDEEPTSSVIFQRIPGKDKQLRIRREIVHRALWERSSVISGSESSSGDGDNIICAPLIGVQKTVGVIYLSSLGAQSRFLDEHASFLNTTSGIAAVTLENVLSLESLKAENRRLRAELVPSDALIGESKPMRRVKQFIDKVAQGDSTVLIRGESGTGKEVVARAIHMGSTRENRPFVPINCAAIPETLLESELFGHEKGAFTGAVGTKKGKLEVAENGTLFLDEIAEMAPMLQAKLLRVLQQKEYERLGGTRPLKLEARVLAATNKNVEQAIKTGEFRQDLFYRLNVVSVALPALREHREDIPLLAIFFATRSAERSNRPFKGISAEARSMLMNYDWPGNVRELENAIEHAIVLGTADEILPEDLPETLAEKQASKPLGGKYQQAINDLKKRLIMDAVTEAKGSYTEAAKLLGVHPNYLHRLIRNLDIKGDLRDIEDA